MQAGIHALVPRGNDVALLAIATSSATVIRVATDGTGDHTSIQDALDATSAGDVIGVGPGTYEENLSVTVIAITITSTDGPETTLLDATSILPLPASRISENSTISDITIRERAQASRPRGPTSRFPVLLSRIWEPVDVVVGTTASPVPPAARSRRWMWGHGGRPR